MGSSKFQSSLAESPLPALDVILRIEADRFTVLLRDRDQLRILFLQRLKYRLYRAPHSVAVRVVMGRNVNVRLVRPQALKRSTRCERIENVRRHSRQSDIHAPHALAFLRKQPGPADSGAVLARTGAGYVLKEREKVIQETTRGSDQSKCVWRFPFERKGYYPLRSDRRARYSALNEAARTADATRACW